MIPVPHNGHSDLNYVGYRARSCWEMMNLWMMYSCPCYWYGDRLMWMVCATENPDVMMTYLTGVMIKVPY